MSNPRDKTSTSFTVIIVEKVVKAPVGEGRGITGSRGGVFIDTSTPVTTKVGVVTTPGKAGSTTNIEDVGLVITFRPVVLELGALGKPPSSHHLTQQGMLSVPWKEQ